MQAKYFFQLGSKELEQISKSLAAAGLNHPTLTEYWVYIPFDLTGRVAGGKRGQGEVERYEAWKKATEQHAVAEGKLIRSRSRATTPIGCVRPNICICVIGLLGLEVSTKPEAIQCIHARVF